MKKHNFYAGPAILPAPVIEQAAAAAKEINQSGLSILEISHRSPTFVQILEEAESLLRELLGLSEDYHVLFLTGGASSQFYMSAMNFLAQDQTASFLDTGTWSTKSIKEAKHFGNVNIVASSSDKNYNYIPKGFDIPNDHAYLHLTSDNTIFGTQIQEFPKSNIPIICDMSSDIFSRPLNLESFGMIYAGAQKNTGPAGTTIAIIRKDMIGKANRTIPTMLDYQTHITKKSSFNTPPVFPIYVCMLTLRWLKSLGGLSAMQKMNEEKAALLYNEIDSNPLFKGTVAKEDRSLMNVTFLLEEESKNEAFLKAADEAGCVGLKGHRSVGGFRASIYNAMPKESVEVLVQVMKSMS